MTTHDTIVIGATKDHKVVFFQSFFYAAQKEEAQAAFGHAMTYPIWYISGIDEGSWELNHIRPDLETFTFSIPQQKL